MEAYGIYLRSYDAVLCTTDDEPQSGHETVLTINLKVGSDLDPVWTLVSDRAEAQGQQPRFLTWADRVRISPTRIGALADHNLAWRRGSVLNRLSEERADTAAALASAARNARNTFGDLAEEQLGQTLKIVTDTAKSLGINVGDKLKAMLDAHSVSFSGGTIALHGENGVPLRALGIGSTRLLLAGLQRKAAEQATIILIDELEYGLEPHRILRLLGSIGAKESSPPLQAFLTTHSPVALRELNGEQLVILRKRDGVHEPRLVSKAPPMQSTIRCFPEAFLAPSVLVCEGASEVGLVRGIDQYYTSTGSTSLTAYGVALVDGGGCDKIYSRANPLRELGYRVAVLRDDDKRPETGAETTFTEAGCPLFRWTEGLALEDELFRSLPDPAVTQLLEYAIELYGEDRVSDQIKTVSENRVMLADCRSSADAAVRSVLGATARKRGWFKTVSLMEEVGQNIVGPALKDAEPGLRGVIVAIGKWAVDGWA